MGGGDVLNLEYFLYLSFSPSSLLYIKVFKIIEKERNDIMFIFRNVEMDL